MSEEARYALTIGGLPARFVQVLTMSGREGISRLYSYDLVIVTSLPEAPFNALVLGQRGRFAMVVSGHRRIVHGVVSRIQHDGWRGASGRGMHQYRIRLSPRAWLLRKRKSSFIFQDLRIDQVIDRVAKEKQVATRWDLADQLPTRPYCTQFEETDYAFIRRLCAENGILFTFEQGGALESTIDTVLDEALSAAKEALGPLPLPELGKIGDLMALMPQPGLDGGFGQETMVFSDQAHYPPLGHTPIVPTLELRPMAGAMTGEHDNALSDAATVHRVVSSGAIYREYDPARPLAELEAVAGGAKAAPTILPVVPGLTIPGMPTGGIPPIPGAPAVPAVPNAPAIPSAPSIPQVPGVPMAPGLPGVIPPIPGLSELGLPIPGFELEGLDIYEHGGIDTSPDWKQTKSEPERILQQHRRHGSQLKARSYAVMVEAGRSFRLDGEKLDLADRAFAVVEVTHEGRATFHDAADIPPYANRFRAVPSAVVYVPKRPRRRSVQVCMTALVVGPKGEEIHVNNRGEIRLKFYWDRRPDRDTPTCWVRTMHGWAGTAWGTQFIPRVGMEAVVVFEGGDPDRPLVLGTVYNGILPPPFALPEQKTRSGIRTQSSPNATGHNELSFEDAAHREQVYLRAERDFDSLVQHDRTAVVHHRDTETVHENQYLTVNGSQEIHVVGKRDAHLASDDGLHVEGSRHVQVDHAQEEQYGTRSVSIAQNDRASINGDVDRVVGGNVAVVAAGNVTLLVGSNEAQRSLAAVVAGSTNIQADGAVMLNSEKEIVLSVGTSYVRIANDRIEISADKVQVRGKDAAVSLDDGKATTTAKSKIQLISEDAVLLKSKGAGIGLQTEARVDGSKVLLNSPANASDEAEVEQPEVTTLEVVDQDGEPAAHQPYRIQMSDGSEVTGFLDENGRAEVPMEDAGQVTFPGLNEVEES